MFHRIENCSANYQIWVKLVIEAYCDFDVAIEGSFECANEFVHYLS